MNLNINILTIILWYQCLEIKCVLSTPRPDKPINGTTRPTKKLIKKLSIYYTGAPNLTALTDCLFPVPNQDYHMPMPITAFSPHPDIILPNVFGNLEVKHNEHIKLSCPGSYFITPIFNRKINEVRVKCINKTLVEYYGKSYEFREFECNAPPRPNLRLTNLTCQNNTNNRILKVGFQTKNKNIVAYKICFDTVHKNPLYTWYDLQSPYVKRRQAYRLRHEFIKSNLYHPWDLEELYSIPRLRETFVNISRSTHITDFYLRSYDGKHFVVQGHLTSETEFLYSFQQSATYVNENTVPQWQIYQDTVWKDIQMIFRRNLAVGKSRRLVVTGTYDVGTLPNFCEVDTPLYLALPNIIPVPKYLWKLDYDLDKKTGVVFLTLNNPYKAINETGHICDPVECPSLRAHFTKYMKKFYCCDVKSFEKVYGELDPIIYERHLDLY